MAVKIRLARFGCRNQPFYRLMVADSSFRRDGRHIEFVGYYDPISGKDGSPKRMGLNLERIRYWLSVGAQPSETVERLLIRAGILPSFQELMPEPNDGLGDSPAAEPMSGSVLDIALPVDAGN